MSGERILVVEDEAVVARDHQERLESFGYRVVGTVATAAEALSRAAESSPDLALVDIRLQGNGDGIAAAGELRQRFGIPAIFLTAYADEETLQNARKAQPLGYLIKPFQDRELRATIEMALERHRAERALRDSELRLRTLVEVAPDAIALADSQGRVELCNREAGAVLSKGAEPATGRGLFDFVEGGQNGWSRAFLEELAGKGAIRGREIKLGNNGGERWLEVSASLFRDGPGSEPGIVAVMRDVTARKRAESELARMAAAVRLAHEMIVIADGSGKVMFANEAAEAAFGIGQDGMTGTGFLDLLAPEDREKGRLVLADVVKKGTLAGVELCLLRHKGEPVPVELSAAALGDSADGQTGIVLISRDVTEKRRRERELRSQLMSHELDDGNIYLVREQSPALSLDAFRDLQKAGYAGAVLSRTPPAGCRFEKGRPVDLRWMAEKGDKSALAPNLAAIEQWVESFPQNRALLVDRLDFVISKNGFRRTLHFIHRLRELAFLMGHVVILSIDPGTVSERELRALGKECREVVPRARPDLPRDELDVLRFVYEQEIKGARPSLTETGGGLGLSKPTARKRVRDLVRWGLLSMSPRGRTRVLEVTEQGRRMFSK